MYCPKCGKPINDNQNFCGECGTTLHQNNIQQNNSNVPVNQPKGELKKQCSNCGVFNPADASICPKCGRDMNTNWSYSNNHINKNSDNNDWIWGCCCLLIIVIIIFALL